MNYFVTRNHINSLYLDFKPEAEKKKMVFYTTTKLVYILAKAKAYATKLNGPLGTDHLEHVIQKVK